MLQRHIAQILTNTHPLGDRRWLDALDVVARETNLEDEVRIGAGTAFFSRFPISRIGIHEFALYVVEWFLD